MKCNGASGDWDASSLTYPRLFTGLGAAEIPAHTIYKAILMKGNQSDTQLLWLHHVWLLLCLNMISTQIRKAIGYFHIWEDVCLVKSTLARFITTTNFLSSQRKQGVAIFFLFWLDALKVLCWILQQGILSFHLYATHKR